MYKERIVKLKDTNNKSKKDIANILKIDRTTYTHYENEDDIIPIKHLNTICNYFKVSMDYILGLTNKSKYTNCSEEIDVSKTIIRLKHLRKEYKLTQGGLAKELNSANTTISGYERGARIIATPFLYAICKKYNISADYLLGKTDEPKNYK